MPGLDIGRHMVTASLLYEDAQGSALLPAAGDPLRPSLTQRPTIVQ